jgi:hypothetical protein
VKRYQAHGAMTNINDFSDRISPDESMMVDWVKYEPWMDEIEEIANMFPTALHPRDEYNLKIKKENNQ